MGLRMRAISFLVLSAVIWTADVWYDESYEPPESTRANIAVLNGGDTQASALRSRQHFKDAATVGAAALTVGLFLLCIGTYPGKPYLRFHQ